MEDKIKKDIQDIHDFKSDSVAEIEEFRIKFLGKKGLLNSYFVEFKSLDSTEKKNAGRLLNELKNLAHENLEDVSPEERAHKGIFMSFQYPIEIPGVTTTNFIKTAINETRKAQGEKEMSAKDMLQKLREKCDLLDIDQKFLSRSINDGFSGGEKKRNEIFQMAMLEPKLAILDETDSGLDIDALKIVANGVNKLKSNDNAVLVITHYQRLLDHIVPDFVHVLFDGKIVKSGGKELAFELEEKGYDWIKEEIKS